MDADDHGDWLHEQRRDRKLDERAAREAELHDSAASALRELEVERDRLRALVKCAKCPNCDGSGAILHGPLRDGSWEAEQCQWCYERSAALEPKP